MDFNLQQFLSEMRREQREEIAALREGQATIRQEQKDDHEKMAAKVDKIGSRIEDHETRLVVVENTRKTMRWLSGAFITTMIGGVITFLIGLFKR